MADWDGRKTTCLEEVSVNTRWPTISSRVGYYDGAKPLRPATTECCCDLGLNEAVVSMFTT